LSLKILNGGIWRLSNSNVIARRLSLRSGRFGSEAIFFLIEGDCFVGRRRENRRLLPPRNDMYPYSGGGLLFVTNFLHHSGNTAYSRQTGRIKPMSLRGARGSIRATKPSPPIDNNSCAGDCPERSPGQASSPRLRRVSPRFAFKTAHGAKSRNFAPQGRARNNNRLSSAFV
jgi:hypothetical protein